MLDSKTLYVKDENGKEVAMDILFTFESDQTNKQYVLFVNPNDETGEVYASCYDDDGNLLPIETDEEWARIKDVLRKLAKKDEA